MAGAAQIAGPGDDEQSYWLTRSVRTILFLATALLVAGAYAMFQTPVAVFPETNFPRVVIGVDNGVMPVEQMQVTITKPIEDAVNSVPGLVTVRSNTSRGSAEVSLFFDWSADMFRTLQLVDAALSKVQQSLPATAKLTTNRLTFATFPILGYSLTSETLSQTQLWELATYTLKPPLNRVAGVSTVTIQGGAVPEFHVVPNMAKLQAAGVTILDVTNAIQVSNIIDSPGLYERDHQLVLALVGAQAHDVDGLKQLTVKTSAGGAAVRIGDLADVVPGTMPVYTAVRANGRPAVLLNVTRQPSSNTAAVANAVAAQVEQLRTKLPRGVSLAPYYDQSEIVRESVRSVRDAILIGLVLACVILFLFLRDWRASLIAGLVIPVTVAATVLVLWVMGESFNLMTLGGLAAAIGLVIDDAIVVVENIVLHREAGQGRSAAVRSALREIVRPLIGSTITPVVVFLPLIAVTGVTGSFFRALAITMTIALLASLLLAVTFTPALAMLLLGSEEIGLLEKHRLLLDSKAAADGRQKQLAAFLEQAETRLRDAVGELKDQPSGAVFGAAFASIADGKIESLQSLLADPSVINVDELTGLRESLDEQLRSEGSIQARLESLRTKHVSLDAELKNARDSDSGRLLIQLDSMRWRCNYNLSRDEAHSLGCPGKDLAKPGSADPWLKQRIAELEQEMAAAGNAIVDGQEELAAAKKQSDSTRRRLATQTSEIERVRGDIERKSGVWEARKGEADRYSAVWSELEKLETRQGSAQKKIDQSAESLRTARSRFDRIKGELSEHYNTVLKRIISPAAEGSIEIDGDGIRPISNEAVADSGTTLREYADVLSFDLSCLAASVCGVGQLPRLWIHDSPRQADSEEELYHSILRFVADLEAKFLQGRKPSFQYILTTTSVPAPEVNRRPFTRCRLHARTDAGRLLTRNFGK